jgi:hypothetical protein
MERELVNLENSLLSIISTSQTYAEHNSNGKVLPGQILAACFSEPTELIDQRLAEALHMNQIKEGLPSSVKIGSCQCKQCTLALSANANSGENRIAAILPF